MDLMVILQFEMEKTVPTVAAEVLWELCGWSGSMNGVDLVLLLCFTDSNCYAWMECI